MTLLTVYGILLTELHEEIPGAEFQIPEGCYWQTAPIYQQHVNRFIEIMRRPVNGTTQNQYVDHEHSESTLHVIKVSV